MKLSSLKYFGKILSVFVFLVIVVSAQTAFAVQPVKETYTAKQPIVLNRQNQQNASTVSIISAAKGNSNVLGANDLVFTVTPDSNGNWTYSIPEGLDPGTYTVTVKDQNGNVLETSTFTIVSTSVTTAPTTIPVSGGGTNLPNTGVLDDLLLPISLVILFSTVAIFALYKVLNSKKVIE